MRRLFVAAVAFGLVSAACSSSTTDSTEVATEPETTTTTPQATTTTAAATTTAPPTTTTTTMPAGETVAATPRIGVLQPYNDAGGALFPQGSVEAHWYQWDGLYVVLYRGWDASDGSEICAGNSVLLPAGTWTNITNSPYNATAEEICVGTESFAEAPSGVYACGALLYYVTAIPTDAEGSLFGTLELGDGEWAGQTSQTEINLPDTPEFEPGLTAYVLPPSGVDDGGPVECG
jgi:hypothetical protein